MQNARFVVGTDLVRVSDVSTSIGFFGRRYLERLFTPRELADCQGQTGCAPERLAARFAAKEATLKALQPRDEALSWRAIEVVRAPWGAPKLALHGPALTLARRRGLTAFSVSLTHEAGYASAVVIAERKKRRRRARPTSTPSTRSPRQP
ncbi:MAG: holo-ACP synthase [Myxococcaceae bacterium]|nr:holo-ACP synthase [Myxococcaceae bacterium]MCI0673571.1 holo-ACP synthase [Myxococcaceae bacterium]